MDPTVHNHCLTSVSDSVGGNITWTYDTVSSGHHPRVQETTTPGTVTVEYDEIGRRLKLSATGQTDVTYTYDKNSRLKTVAQGTQTATLAYDNAGRRTSLTYPNGVVTSYGYDNANRLLSIDHIKTPTTIETLTYVNDAAGNRIKLTRANAAATLIPQAVTNTAFDAANEQTRFNSASTNLVYDNNGNLTSFTDASGTTTYTWNARNQLSAISGPSLSASFVYDGLGRRSSKTINSATTGFWYDGDDVLAELSGSTPTATYIRSLSIDEPFIRKQSGGDEFYQTDALGSALGLTDASGSSNTTYTQEPFGKTTKTGTSTNAFQYTGREDDGTGLKYYRTRYYSAGLQRFISEDLLPSGSNLYTYVLNSPIRYIDPLGLYQKDVHYDLTFWLARQAGYSVNDARAIAGADQGVDDSWKTCPIMCGVQARQDWHFTDNLRRSDLWNNAVQSGNLTALGQFLHAQQDAYSHRGYDAEWGHARHGTAPDIACRRPELAIKMAQDTYTYLRVFRQMQTGALVPDQWQQLEITVGRKIRDCK